MAEKMTVSEWAEHCGCDGEARYLKERIADIGCRFEVWPASTVYMQLGLTEMVMDQVEYEIELMGLWDAVLKSGAYQTIEPRPKGDG